MGFFSKIKTTVSGASEKILSKFRKIDLNQVEDLEEVFLQSDFGVEVTDEIVERIKDLRPKDINLYVRKYLLDILNSRKSDLLDRNFSESPYVILVVGVNGNGKTTTIAKLAHHFKSRNLSVRVGACDTFRAAAVEQLAIWCNEIGCDITVGNDKSDPASVAYKAYIDSCSSKNDILIIDTAGRLHTRDDLMQELLKIKNVLRKNNKNAPHETVIVLDGITGQNAFTQIEKFSKVIGVDSVIVTKLDSTAKGGVIVGIIKDFQLPVSAVCFGEDVRSIKVFSADEYVDAIFQ